jgi:hypothetical protein
MPHSAQYDVFKVFAACNDIINDRVVGFGVSTSVYSIDDGRCSYSGKHLLLNWPKKVKKIVFCKIENWLVLCLEAEI